MPCPEEYCLGIPPLQETFDHPVPWNTSEWQSEISEMVDPSRLYPSFGKLVCFIGCSSWLLSWIVPSFWSFSLVICHLLWNLFLFSCLINKTFGHFYAVELHPSFLLIEFWQEIPLPSMRREVKEKTMANHWTNNFASSLQMERKWNASFGKVLMKVYPQQLEFFWHCNSETSWSVQGSL